VLARLERKLAEIQVWVDSVGTIADWPAAIALAILRTRAADTGLFARTSRALLPSVRVRPAALNGFCLTIHPHDLAEFTVYQEVFIDGVYDVNRVAFTPDAIVDCGAYQGYFTLLGHARFPSARLIAFEPDARNAQRLQANLRANRVTAGVRSEAVSTRDGEASFVGGGCGGKLTEVGGGAIAVKTSDLRRVIAELESAALLLKLDIEGEEATLLPALMPSLPAQCAIFFEWHQGRETFERVAEMMAGNGLLISVTRSREFEGTTFIDAFAQRA